MSHLGRFHHLGMACRSIEAEASVLQAIGYVAEAPAMEDPIQKVRLQFVVGGGPRIELLEPTSVDSPVQAILKRGASFYHLAYEVDEFDRAIVELTSGQYRPIGPAAPSVAFDMRRIIFMMSDTLTVIELIEGRP